MAYELPPLPYDYAALEPHIDEATMKLHHDKHHQAYVTNLNGAVEKHPDLGKKSPEELLKDLNAIPEDVRKVVQNNGGGHVNHTMFWQIMKPKGGGDPSGDIAAQIKADFGDFESFKKLFNETTAKQFGSGWGWLIFKAGKLAFLSGGDELIQEAALLGRIDLPAASLCDVLPRASNQLSRIGFAHLQDLSDLIVRIVEGLSKDVRSSLVGSKSFEQQQHGKLQRLTALRSQSWIGAGVHWLRKPDSEILFPSRPSRFDDVNR